MFKCPFVLLSLLSFLGQGPDTLATLCYYPEYIQLLSKFISNLIASLSRFKSLAQTPTEDLRCHSSYFTIHSKRKKSTPWQILFYKMKSGLVLMNKFFTNMTRNEDIRLKILGINACALADPVERTVIEYSDRSLT